MDDGPGHDDACAFGLETVPCAPRRPGPARAVRVSAKREVWKMKKTIAIFAVLLVACTLQVKQRGFIFPKDWDKELQTIKTAADLERTFGSPQAKTVFGDTIWIYYGANENYRGPFPLTYDDKTALLVWLDGNGKVTGKRILRDDELPNVRPTSGETPIPAAVELNAIQELINNIGRFTPSGIGQ